MSAKFYTLLTDIGAAKLASAAALWVTVAEHCRLQARSRQRWLLKSAVRH